MYRRTHYKSAFIPVVRADDFIDGEKGRAGTTFYNAKLRGDMGGGCNDEVCNSGVLLLIVLCRSTCLGKYKNLHAAQARKSEVLEQRDTGDETSARAAGSASLGGSAAAQVVFACPLYDKGCMHRPHHY